MKSRRNPRRVPGLGLNTSGTGGSFSLGFDQTGRLPMIVDGPGYWRRETQIRVEPSAEVELDLLPSGRDFDLVFFDHVFRDKGLAGTRRWTGEPTFEIWAQQYTCATQNQDGFCVELDATDGRAASPFEGEAHTVITTDSQTYTGGFVAGSRITTVTHPAGTHVGLAQMLVTGKVTVALVETPSRWSWAWWRYSNTRRMLAGHIQINKDHRSYRDAYSHELAHVLGFDHPDGHASVPGRSIMRNAGPTLLDILHGRVLYRRPPGSRTPDKDPDDFSLNLELLADASSEDGTTVIRR